MSEEIKLPWVVKAAGACLALCFMALGWYFFWARHPHVTLAKPLPESQELPVCARVGAGEVLLVTGASATLVDLASGKELWTANLGGAATKDKIAPAGPAPVSGASDAQAQAAKLKTWYADLARRRGKLTTPAETQAFNDEAARYQIEAAALKKLVAGAASSTTEEKQVTAAELAKRPSPEEQIRLSRAEKEATRLRLWSEKLSAQRAAAKTPLQMKTVAAETARYEAAVAVEKGAAPKAIINPEARLSSADPGVSAANDPGEKPFWLPPSPPEVLPFASSIWVVKENAAMQLERSAGRLMCKLTLPGKARHAWGGSASLYVLTEAPGSRQIVRLHPDGTSNGWAVAGSAGETTRTDSSGNPSVFSQHSEFAVNDDVLLQMESRLLNRKITEYQAMKGSSQEDWSKTDKETSGGFGEDAAKFAQTMANDAKREQTGGVDRVDESSYAVTISRPMEKDGAKPLWSGSVTGHTQLFALSTVNLLVSGTAVIALDRSGKQLWEAKLAYPLRPAELLLDTTLAGSGQPCGEWGDNIYLYDRAFLTAYRRDSGQVLWRLPSVGIHRLHVDGDGKLYLCTDNAPAESVRFTQESHLTGGGVCSILQVDGKDGRVLWNVPKFQDCRVGDGGIYASRFVVNPNDATEQAFTRKAAPQHFLLAKLSKRDGSQQWSWNEDGHALQVEPAGRKVGVLFDKRFETLKSLAL